jgi:hypothetical protein
MPYLCQKEKHNVGKVFCAAVYNDGGLTMRDETTQMHTRVCPKVSGLVARSRNCKWYSSLLLGAVVSLLCESVK